MYSQVLKIKGKDAKEVNITLPKLLQDNDLINYDEHLYLVSRVIIRIKTVEKLPVSEYVVELQKLK